MRGIVVTDVIPGGRGLQIVAEHEPARLLQSDLLERIADKKDATPAQIALAWVLAQKPSIVPIPGTTKRSYLGDNIEAAGIELTAEDLEAIEEDAAQIDVHGHRYSESAQQLIDR